MELIMSTNLSGAVTSLQGGRPENQDDYCFGETPNGYLIVVCDGMGGGPGGKTASYLAKTAIANTIKGSQPSSDRIALVRKAVQDANTAVFEASVTNPVLRGMGTTAVVLLINERSAIVGHVGDSRLYKMRMGMVVYRTQDHSLVGDMVRQKVITEEQARLSTQSNILKRAVGVKPDLEVDVEEIAYEKGDRFVLCSDGVWGALDKKSLVSECTKKKNVSVIVESLAEHIDSIGRSNGSHHDNLTLAIVETRKNSQLHEKMSKYSIRILLVFLLITILSLITAFVMFSKSKSVSILEKENARLVAELKNRDTKIDSLQSRISLAKEENAITKGATKNAELSAEIVNEENARLKKRIDELEQKLQESNGKKAEKDNSEVKTQLQKVIEKLQKLRDTAPSATTSNLKSNLSAAKKAVDEAKNLKIKDNIADLKKYLNLLTFNYQNSRNKNKYELTGKQKTDLDAHIRNLKEKSKHF